MAKLTLPTQYVSHFKGESQFTLDNSNVSDALQAFFSKQNVEAIFLNDKKELNQFIRVAIDSTMVDDTSWASLKTMTLNDNSDVLLHLTFLGG